MKRRVTLDTNIFVSALEFGGKPMIVVQAGLDGEIDIAVSQPIIDETLRVLREKFDWVDADLHDAEATVIVATFRVAPSEVIDAVKADPTDNRILECAVASGSEQIVSGDRQLLTLGRFRGIERSIEANRGKQFQVECALPLTVIEHGETARRRGRSADHVDDDSPDDRRHASRTYGSHWRASGSLLPSGIRASYRFEVRCIGRSVF